MVFSRGFEREGRWGELGWVDARSRSWLVIGEDGRKEDGDES